MGERIKILFLAADPVDTSRLRLGKEIKEIDKKIQATTHRDSFELVSEWAVTAEDLLQALLRHCPHIVHFSGHGSKLGSIILEDEYGEAQIADKQALTSLFQVLKDNIRIVVLNACYSKPQADAIRQVIDYTIGMNTTIADGAAILFSATFYSALGFGRSVKEAFNLAIIALQMKFPQGHKTPVLRLRKGVDPAGRSLIWENTGPSPAEISAFREKWDNEPDPWKRYWLAVSMGDIGGKKAIEVLRRIRSQESDEFALMGVDAALRMAGGRAP
jgi:CHAT domain